MHYNSPLQSAVLIKRYKRFLADIQTTDGQLMTIHCPNTGAMTYCMQEGGTIWYSLSDNKKRKYPATWELAEVFWPELQKQKAWVGVNTHRANVLVQEAIENEMVRELTGYEALRKEVRWQTESRLDFLLTHGQKPPCYVEVKSVTLLGESGLGLFPDAKSVRGVKHLSALTEIAKQGNRAVLLYCVQHSGIDRVTAAQSIDPEYAQALQKAKEVGVEVIAYRTKISPCEIVLDTKIPVIL